MRRGAPSARVDASISRPRLADPSALPTALPPPRPPLGRAPRPPPPCVHAPPGASRREPAHERDPAALPAIGKGAELLGELLLRVVPGNRLAPLERPAVAVRGVQPLPRNL